MKYNRSTKPWRSGSPHGSRFRGLFNEMGEDVFTYMEMRPELERLIRMSEQLFDEDVAVQESFPAIIIGSSGTGFPKLYTWIQGVIIGQGSDRTYQAVGEGHDTETDGPAINRVEMIDGFGVTVGPYGQPLQTPFATVTVQPIAPLSPTLMTLEKDIDGEIVPVFEAINPGIPQCLGVTPPAAVTF